jgi:hypothetical protein
VLSFQILDGCDVFKFFFDWLNCLFLLYLIWKINIILKITSCCWQYASGHMTLIPNYGFFEFLNGEYNRSSILPTNFSYLYPSTLTNSTLIMLFWKLLKFSKNISSELKNVVKNNNEYLRIFDLLKWKFQNYLIIWQTCVEMAKVYDIYYNLQILKI